jgi:hypothetical protein
MIYDCISFKCAAGSTMKSQESLAHPETWFSALAPSLLHSARLFPVKSDQGSNLWRVNIQLRGLKDQVKFHCPLHHPEQLTQVMCHLHESHATFPASWVVYHCAHRAPEASDKGFLQFPMGRKTTLHGCWIWSCLHVTPETTVVFMWQ